MVITPIGRSSLSQLEAELLSLPKDSPLFLSNVFPIKDHGKTSIYRFGRIIIKTGQPMYIQHEVQMSMRLSAISPVFLPILAYDDHSFVAPYVDGMLLVDSGVNLDFINSISYVIAEALLKADIICRDLHNENVIVTPNGFHVIDLEQYAPMDTHTRKPLPHLANFVFEELTQTD